MSGSYWTKGRYSLLVVWGWGVWPNSGGSSNPPSATLSVLDSHDCWREVRRVRSSERQFEAKRGEVVAWIDKHNRLERVAA